MYDEIGQCEKKKWEIEIYLKRRCVGERKKGKRVKKGEKKSVCEKRKKKKVSVKREKEEKKMVSVVREEVKKKRQNERKKNYK